MVLLIFLVPIYQCEIDKTLECDSDENSEGDSNIIFGLFPKKTNGVWKEKYWQKGKKFPHFLYLWGQ